MVLFDVYDMSNAFVVFCSVFSPEEFNKTDIPEVFKDVYYHLIVTKKIAVPKPMIFFSNKILQNKTGDNQLADNSYILVSFCVIVEPFNNVTGLTASLDYINSIVNNIRQIIYIGSCSLSEDNTFTDYLCGEHNSYQYVDLYRNKMLHNMQTINLTNKTIFGVRSHSWEFIDPVNKLFKLTMSNEYGNIVRDSIIGFDMIKFIDEQLKKINKIRKDQDKKINENVSEQIRNITFSIENIRGTKHKLYDTNIGNEFIDASYCNTKRIKTISFLNSLME
ncbi:MAG: hypothetical protein Terrestrivirus12_26 [Terrestrivirus sp.]|uniref:Uncharacterized protein n=1 Tax=Terrestrivirus sp. TaxID=2487775 RepID=A0A3G4ZSZ5_9VIRU|nr:MAG: hypothetical protein Terrestrivirus12_26 [Terrestrivirus sp.]